MAVCFLIRVLFERPGLLANLALFFSPLGWMASAGPLSSRTFTYIRQRFQRSSGISSRNVS